MMCHGWKQSDLGQLIHLNTRVCASTTERMIKTVIVRAETNFILLLLFVDVDAFQNVGG